MNKNKLTTLQKIQLGVAGLTLWFSFETYSMSKAVENIVESNNYNTVAADEYNQSINCKREAYDKLLKGRDSEAESFLKKAEEHEKNYRFYFSITKDYWNISEQWHNNALITNTLHYFKSK